MGKWTCFSSRTSITHKVSNGGNIHKKMIPLQDCGAHLQRTFDEVDAAIIVWHQKK